MSQQYAYHMKMILARIISLETGAFCPQVGTEIKDPLLPAGEQRIQGVIVAELMKPYFINAQIVKCLESGFGFLSL